MTILDSDILVGVLRGNENAIAKCKNLADKGIKPAITPISVIELFYGASKSKSKLELMHVESLLATLMLVDLDIPAMKIAGQLLAELEKSGSVIGDMDTIIAAIAIANNETLVSRNKKHFERIKGLKLEKW